LHQNLSIPNPRTPDISLAETACKPEPASSSLLVNLERWQLSQAAIGKWWVLLYIAQFNYPQKVIDILIIA
jgi:hypothetical protein